MYSTASAASAASAPATERPNVRHRVVTHLETEKAYGPMLRDLHKSLRVELGEMFHWYPNHGRFPTPAGAKQLAEKWSRSFQDKRDDFKKAGLWVRIFIDTKNKSVKVTVEKNKALAAEIAAPVPTCPPLPPCPPIESDETVAPPCPPPMPYGYPMDYGFPPVPYGLPMPYGTPPMPYGYPMPYGVPPMPYGYPMSYGAPPMPYGYPMSYSAPPATYGVPEYSEEEEEEEEQETDA